MDVQNTSISVCLTSVSMPNHKLNPHSEHCVAKQAILASQLTHLLCKVGAV